MVIKYTGEDLYKSTYHSFYAKDPRIETANQSRPKLSSTLTPRKRTSEYRQLRRQFCQVQDTPISLGLGCTTDVPLQRADKEIVSSSWPQRSRLSYVRKDLTARKASAWRSDCKNLGDIVQRLPWISSTVRQQEEAYLPIPDRSIPATTWEPHADIVRLQSRTHTPKIDRQKILQSWDKTQWRRQDFGYRIRHRTCGFHHVGTPGCDDANQDSTNSFDLLNKTLRNETEIDDDDYRRCSDFSIADLSRVRSLPGYSGYVPRVPVEREKVFTKGSMLQSYPSTSYQDFARDTATTTRSVQPHFRILNLPNTSSLIRKEIAAS